MRLSIRPAGDGDREWLFDLHEAAMRAGAEAAYGPWDRASQRERFLARTEPDVRIVSVDGIDVGAVHLSDGPDGSLYIGLIEVLPEHQNRGIGTAVIRALDEEAARAGSGLALRVRKANRAKSLYDRLGFRTVDEDETHFHMLRT